MNYDHILSLCEQKRISLPQLADKIGASRAGIYRMIEDKTMKVETLEKIAEALEVPVGVFFDIDQHTVNRINDLEDNLNRSGVIINNLKRQYMKLLMAYLDFDSELSHDEKEQIFNRKGALFFLGFLKGFTGNQQLYDEMEQIVANISKLLGDKFDLSEGSGSPIGDTKRSKHAGP